MAAMPARRDRDKTGLSLFTDELRAARQRAGWSSAELADKLGYAASTVRMVEAGHRAASPDFAKQCDKVFRTPGFSDDADQPAPGTFMRIELLLRDLPFPASYRPFIPHERAARVLRIFEASFVTGLFQTPEYARGAGQAAVHHRRGSGEPAGDAAGPAGGAGQGKPATDLPADG
jgi:transcriptional regulator with XRE-family HTH domain